MFKIAANRSKERQIRREILLMVRLLMSGCNAKTLTELTTKQPLATVIVIEALDQQLIGWIYYGSLRPVLLP